MSETVASYHDREAWLAERKTGIGGSDAAVILGVSPYKTARQLWAEKVGHSQEDDVKSPGMLRGTYLEPVAADLYVEKTGRSVRRQPMRRHPDFEWMIGNVDRQILAVGDVQSTGILEIKCPGLSVLADVKAHGLLDYMTVQLMHYLAVYGYEWGSFALFNAERWDLIWFDLEANREFIDRLIAAERDFWIDHVLTGIPPDEPDVAAANIPEVEGELTVIEDPEWRRAALDMREARQLKDAAARLEDEAKSHIQELMHRQEVQAVEVPEIARFYYRWQQGRTQWKKTAEAIADAAQLPLDEYLIVGEGFKVFSPYFYRGDSE